MDYIEFTKRFRGSSDEGYKYYSINSNFLSAIKDGYLWLANIASFNDPLDCYTKLISFEGGKRALQHYNQENPPTGNRKVRRDLLKVRSKINSEKLKDLYISSLEDSIKDWGVSCFTQDYKNVLMWSHYAENYTGVCLKFDFSNDPEEYPLLKVEYTKEFKPIDFYDKDQNAILRMFTTKAKAWEYEDELRICRKIDTFNGRKLVFPKAYLKGIIFGCKINPTMKHVIIDLIKKSGYKSIFYKQAHLTNNSFSLDFIDEYY